MSSGGIAPELTPAAFGRGAIIGRYVVLGLIGRGGMGEVYGAYDPELDRKIALKLFRVKPGNGVSPAEGRQRLLREAQAIARLSHPNVVVVYDVGMFEDKVFIAMEFVDGNTATYWQAAAERTWKQTLEVFVAAGRGLAAAHEKGIVHRDFKPDNVMVGRDSQVRVMDFGLARQANERPANMPPTTTPAAPIPIHPSVANMMGSEDTVVLQASAAAVSEAVPEEIRSDVPGVLDIRITRPGAMMGTPAYMAAEQFRGMPADARSDQFSFCVSLYEALYGERPFPGSRVSGLANNVVRGDIRPPPAGSKVPAWVRRALMRGLRPRPSDRWPSMKDLLDELERDPRVSRRRWMVGTVAVLLVATAGILAVRPMFVPRVQVCAGGPEMVGHAWEIPGDGGPELASHARIRQAFLSTGKSYAPDVFATVARAFNSYAQRWAAMYKENCEATHVRGDQSAEVLDLRMSCLQERLGGLRALTEVFVNATGEVVENAVSAANALSSLDRCADVPLLRAVVRPPEDPAMRDQVDRLRVRFADLRAQFDAGQWKQTLGKVPQLVAEAEALGYEPLIAEALMLQGDALIDAGDPSRAEKALVTAFWRADASRHDEIRAEAAEKLVFIVGYQEGRFEESDRWATAARSILRRMGGHELLQSWLLNDVGCVLHLRGHDEDAVQALTTALTNKQRVLGAEHPDVGLSQANLAMALKGLGRNQEALSHLERATVMIEHGLGSSHPSLATILSNKGEVLNALGLYREARRAFERARGIWEQEFGADNLNLGFALTGIGLSFLGEGNPASAVAPLERAYRVRSSLETEPSRRAETAFALARALWDSSEDLPRARRLAAKAQDDYLKSKNPAKADEARSWLQTR